MTAADLTSLARTARKAGLENLLQVSIVAILLERGEATLLSLANSLGVKLEAVAYACSKLETAGAAKHLICRDAVGFTITRLTDSSEKLFRDYLASSSTPPIRSKNLHTYVTK